MLTFFFQIVTRLMRSEMLGKCNDRDSEVIFGMAVMPLLCRGVSKSHSRECKARP